MKNIKDREELARSKSYLIDAKASHRTSSYRPHLFRGVWKKLTMRNLRDSHRLMSFSDSPVDMVRGSLYRLTDECWNRL